jgi:antitoxin component YwqK of YwqJK toxin-antitoxin module
LYSNGNIKSQYEYINGQKNGLSKEWYDNGNIRIIQNWLNDELHGIFEEYREVSGKIKKLKVYSHNKDISVNQQNKIFKIKNKINTNLINIEIVREQLLEKYKEQL